MKKFIALCLVFCSIMSYAQTKLYQADAQGKVYVVFALNDSVAQVYQGEHTSFTSDGIFAKDFSTFDLAFKGFSKFSPKSNLSDVFVNTSKIIENPINPPIVVIPPVIINPPKNNTTKLFLQSPFLEESSRYWIENEGWGNVGLKAKDIVGMDGYDFAPIVANNLGNLYQYGDWKQSYISVPGNRSVWNDGGAKYFLKPSGYHTDLSYNLMDFDLKFPDFTLPKNKYVIMQPTPSREIGVNNYLKKGVSFVKNRNDSQGYAFVSDAWLLDLGCPPAYTSNKEEMDKWCEQIDADVLLQSFIDNVYFPNRFLGYVMLNWETVGNRWNVRQDKLIRCLEYWQNNYHTAKMALWTVSGIGIGRPIFQGYGIDFSYLLNHEGDLDSFQKQYNNIVGVDFGYAKYVEIGHIGGYQNYPVDDGLVHHYLTELLLHKKYNPNKTQLATVWFDSELINNFSLGREKVDLNGGSYYAQVKPKVTPATAYNWGVWTMLGGGFDCWSDPNTWSENKSDWGWGAIDENGRELRLRHGENLSKFPSQPMKSIDWMMSGVWSVSENKDIVDAETEWFFPVLPTKSYHEKSLLTAYKLSGDGSEALVLLLDGFGLVDGETTHKVVVSGKSYDLKTHGRFTSVVRLKL
jgi:hypothetical protein